MNEAKQIMSNNIVAMQQNSEKIDQISDKGNEIKNKTANLLEMAKELNGEPKKGKRKKSPVRI